MTEELLRHALFLPDAGTAFARRIDRLHFVIVSTTLAAVAIVFVTTFVFIVRFRRLAGSAVTPRVHVPWSVEIGLGSGLLILFCAWWLVGFRQYESIRGGSGPVAVVYVTAKQWMWKFSRPDGSRSASVLVLPRGDAVRLVFTSRDVVHSFYVPAFRIKQDAVPGRYTSVVIRPDRLGTFPVYCAEYCGLSHSRMWANVVVLDPVEYDRYLAGDLPERVALAGGEPGTRGGIGSDVIDVPMSERGRDAASRYGCLACHTTDGQRHVGPTFRGLFGRQEPLADGRTVVADEDYLTRSMMEPMRDVVSGYTPVMPTYQGVLEQPDAAAIVEFIRLLGRRAPEPAVRLPEVVGVKPVPSSVPAPGKEERRR